MATWLVVAAIGLVVAAAATSLVYLRPVTSGAARAVAAVFPYPAAVVGSDVITVGEYLDERDALDAYFASSAALVGAGAENEEEIERNLMETLIHKSAVGHLAETAGIVVDAARVEAFYAQAVGGADSEQFAVQLERTFGWTAEEFRDRVVAPVVLAMQLEESIGRDAGRQDVRRGQAVRAYERLEAGEPFGTVASDTGADASATTGGDVGYVKMSDVPAEWAATLAGLDVGAYSAVVEGTESFLIFQVTDRVEAGDDSEIRLSIVSVPKVTLEEAIQEYLESARVWRFIGRT
jgi:hypothetical protein